jgi:two-component system sensor histidine kinase FlrB
MSDLGRMMSQITHQIKTPLSSALLCSSYLIDQNAGFSEKQAQYLLKIKENIFQIDHYIDSILNFSKGHTQVVEVICLQTLLKEVTRTIEEKIKSTGAVLTVFNSVTEVFWGNRQAWLGVFLNMIDNAIEAVDDQARIMIHARLQADTLCISFQDQGPGISQALKQKIFDPFFTTKAKGTGLGMTIVKSVVEAHQGRVVLSDLPHGQTGTHIMIHIPISKRSRVA